MLLSLAKSIDMRADEHGPGVIARAAAENGYILTSQVVSLAGIGHLRPESLFGRKPESATAVAHVIGADPEMIRRAYHAPLGAGLCDFFGTTIRVKDREIARRRVSPRALKADPYIRAIWQLRPFSFDPATRELLIENCPECGRALGWARAAGICHCESCLAPDEMGFIESTVDLRDYPQPLIEIDDWEALDLVIGLVDPDTVVGTRQTRMFHDELTGLDRGQLFAFALALSCVVDQDPARTATSIARPTTSVDYANYYSPTRLAKAGRILMDWPRGFDNLCEEARADAPVRGHFGVKTELGQIYSLAHNASVDVGVRAVASKAIERNMAAAPQLVRRVEHRGDDGMLTTEAAEAKFGIRTRMLRRLADGGKIECRRAATGKGPRLFREEDVAALSAMRNAVESISAVGIRLGIPPASVRHLGGAGLITPETGPVVGLLTGTEYYLRSSIDKLIARIDARVINAEPPPGRLRLPRAMNRLPVGAKPWAAVVQAIVDGRLDVFRVDGDFTAVLIRLAVASIADVLAVASAENPDQSTTCSRAEAGAILGISVPLVIALVQAGHLPPPETPGGALSRSGIMETAGKLIFTTEISLRSDVGVRAVRPRLAAHGINPAFELERGRGLGYRRVEVEPILNLLGVK